jgi:hypothetical protein
MSARMLLNRRRLVVSHHHVDLAIAQAPPQLSAKGDAPPNSFFDRPIACNEKIDIPTPG